jgi:hypothetical protein
MNVAQVIVSSVITAAESLMAGVSSRARHGDPAVLQDDEDALQYPRLAERALATQAVA